jgi:hypothetical protein
MFNGCLLDVQVQKVVLPCYTDKVIDRHKSNKKIHIGKKTQNEKKKRQRMIDGKQYRCHRLHYMHF